jgi:hypothetical protein
MWAAQRRELGRRVALAAERPVDYRAYGAALAVSAAVAFGLRDLGRSELLVRHLFVVAVLVVAGSTLVGASR